jgi:spore coat polysaccharide biosynthesis protein SpsF
MRHGLIIACRMSSQRLPGKSLAPVAGRPLLWYVHSRLEPLGLPVVVATSDDGSDDAIAAYCRDAELPCHRGSLADVAGRLLSAARAHGLESFARINGDSPFVDRELLRTAFAALEAENLDFVTNLVPRTYPYGVAVEVIRTAAYEGILAESDPGADREHATQAVYRRLATMRHRRLVRTAGDLSARSLTIDTAADLEAFRQFHASRHEAWDRITYHDAIAYHPESRITA